MDEFIELMPGLPEEIALECMARLHYTVHGVAAQVCRRWRELLRSRDFYRYRKQKGHTVKVACLVQSLPVQAPSDEPKTVGPPKYRVSILDPVSGGWERIEPIPQYPDGLPLFCQVESTEGKLVVMGGLDPTSYEPVSHVFVYEFTTRQWKQGKSMPENRSFFATGALEDKVLIAGGHDISKNALRSASIYDLARDEWDELPPMSQERDECEGIVIGSEFWVVSGYKTENQGNFEGSAELLELGADQWKQVDNVWSVNRCPKTCIGVGKDGKLFSWAEANSEVRIGACGVHLGSRTFVSGAAYQGGPRGSNLVEGHDGRLRKLDVAEEFSGFVQSGCCAEI